MKSALFVDFDNIYSGLRQLDQATADRFARSPMTWVTWMVESLALPEHVEVSAKRRILVRRCYLNPQAYQRFRPYFNLGGFEIIDCPALTSGGKTSTDIHMVLDIIDLLQHETRYDEFIVLSADADFTPVLRKLRRWDRRTTVLAIGFPSAAYRASADLVIDQDEFVRGALGIGARDEPATEGRPAPDGDSYHVPSQAPSETASAVAPLPAFSIAPETPVCAVPSPDLRALAALVIREVAASAEPVPCARLASVLSRHPGTTAEWFGHGSFRRLIETLDLPNLQMDWRANGGVAYDQRRHTLVTPEAGANVEDEWVDAPATLTLARQIQEVTGVPLLSPARYRTLFGEIADDVTRQGYNFIETVKRVRARCRERGQPISRADITFVVRGIVLRGHRFDEHANTAGDLAQKFSNNVRSLCLREQIILDSATEAAIKHWICGDMLPA
ncbi:NYN domain-containing protein [Massilia glaciei]|uniref:NYN domain-containing protein n=1 Tax=Massilia glaciei TaxID=1524097 RepID=A0A2U2HPE7_9BURK|nr:NYN domain-containing protein [Massilia glaciei]PWF49332.1 NYN domain-containing protein [Massilia glaciei]